MRTLSGLLREQRIERVDLLKLDAEQCELEVLAGLDEEDWSRIRQAVVEVHDEASVPLVEEQFLTRGFRVTIDVNEHFPQMSLLYAVREEERD